MSRKLIKLTLALVLGAVLLTGVYGGVIYSRIRASAVTDGARQADAIIVLGAAQYNGRPSPVLQARLDHAYDLFERGYASIIITTGGFGPDPNFSEAHVGARYLSERGIHPSQIVTEQGSGTTYDSVQASARLMHANGWKKALVVSDGFHLYRVKQIFADSRIDALTSPAPGSPIEVAPSSRLWYSLREVVLLSAYRLVRLVG